MSLPATNTLEHALDFAETTLRTYLEDRLDVLNDAHSSALVMPDEYRRELIFPRGFVGVAVGIRHTQTDYKLLHDRQTARHSVTVRWLVHGPSVAAEGPTADVILNRALGLYVDATSYVLQRHLRGGQYGVYTTVVQRTAPSRQMMAKDRAGNFAGARDVSVVIHQQQPI